MKRARRNGNPVTQYTSENISTELVLSPLLLAVVSSRGRRRKKLDPSVGAGESATSSSRIILPRQVPRREAESSKRASNRFSAEAPRGSPDNEGKRWPRGTPVIHGAITTVYMIITRQLTCRGLVLVRNNANLCEGASGT